MHEITFNRWGHSYVCVVSGAGANIRPRKVDPLEISGHHLTTDTCTVPGLYLHSSWSSPSPHYTGQQTINLHPLSGCTIIGRPRHNGNVATPIN